MNRHIEQSGEFHKYAGPREMYGFVILKAEPSDQHTYKSSVKWPPDMPENIYNESVFNGIKRAMEEAKIITGEFELKNISLSDNADANVPIAFEQAAYEAAKKIINKWGSNPQE